MDLNHKIQALVKLGQHLAAKPAELDVAVEKAFAHNRWFTPKNCYQGIDEIVKNYLEESKLQKGVKEYIINENPLNKIGLILAGNIPLVGFHDVLSSFITGNVALIKLSDKDKVLLPYFVSVLKAIDERTSIHFQFVDRLVNPDAVIATGSNNSALYFDRYFGKYPHIIRKHRNAIAIIHGDESRDELVSFGKDIFSYFGLGCRNVSKVYLPQNYKIDTLMEPLHEYKDIILHNKYKNNYDFNYAIFLLNKENFFMNGSLILREHTDITSRISCLHFERYSDLYILEDQLLESKDHIQCIVSQKSLKKHTSIPFGAAQSPSLTDFADGEDTVAFLLSLN